MPYKNMADLPPVLKKILPVGAQKIYFKVFNRAWEEYDGDRSKETHHNPEESSHRIAWAAVKKQYQKLGDQQWKPKKEN